MQDFVLFVSSQLQEKGFHCWLCHASQKCIAAFSFSGKRGKSCRSLVSRHWGEEVKRHLMAGKDRGSDKQRSQPSCCGSCRQRRQGEGKLGSSSLPWELPHTVKWEACGW